MGQAMDEKTQEMQETTPETDGAPEQGEESPRAPRFGVGVYFKMLQMLIVSPRQFFTAMGEDTAISGCAFKFLLISGVFHSCVYMTYFTERTAAVAIALVLNALGMPVLLAGLTHLAHAMTSSDKISFRKLFAIYAFATGTTMIVSWIPAVHILTELWRFILVVIGLVKACGLSWVRSVLLVLAGVVLLLMLFWSLFPLLLGTA